MPFVKHVGDDYKIYSIINCNKFTALKQGDKKNYQIQKYQMKISYINN